jgi:hypothetical protein
LIYEAQLSQNFRIIKLHAATCVNVIYNLIAKYACGRSTSIELTF